MSEKSKPFSEASTELKRKTSVKFILASKAIQAVFRNYFLLSVCGTACDVVFTLLAYTPVHLGGLSRTVRNIPYNLYMSLITYSFAQPGEIGYALAFSGAAGAVIQVVLFPLLHDRFGGKNLYRFLMLLWPLQFALFPVIAYIARVTAPPEALSPLTSEINVGAPGEGGLGASDMWYPAGWLLWAGIAVTLGVFRCASMCYSCVLLLHRITGEV